MDDWSIDWQKEFENQKNSKIKVNGLTVSEIADEMNCELVTVYRYLSKEREIPAERILRWCEITGQRPEDVNERLYPSCCNPVIESYLNRFTKVEKTK